MPYCTVCVPAVISRVVGPVPVAPLSSAMVNGMEALHVTAIEDVALSAEVSSDAVPKFMLLAETLHWFATVAETDIVPLTVVVPPAPARAAQLDCEVVSQ